MEKYIKRIPKFSATLTIGLEEGYSNKQISKASVISELQHYQERRIKDSNTYLSARVSSCEIVLSNQIEPHLRLDFINYPRLEVNPTTLKDEIINLSQHLMNTFFQNRIVIEFNDEIVMIENNNKIDPRIN